MVRRGWTAQISKGRVKKPVIYRLWTGECDGDGWTSFRIQLLHRVANLQILGQNLHKRSG